MSEQVKRYADTFCESGGESWSEMQECPDGAYVRYSDYDALRAEAEALQRQVTELTNQRDAILLQAHCWAGEAKTQQAITKAVSEALGGVPDWGSIVAGVEALQAESGRKQQTIDGMNAEHWKLVRSHAVQAKELEAARGLLREVRQSYQLPDWARSQIDKLTVRPT